jgi:acetyltransferase-like isoleucine patch superfamily enzyme
MIRLFSRWFYDARRHARRLPFVRLGEGTTLLRGSRFEFHQGSREFKGAVEVGNDCVLFCDFVFESLQGRIQIGDRCFINSGTRLISRESIRIGSDVTIAWGCTLYDHNSHSLDWRSRRRDLAKLRENLRAGRNLADGKDWDQVKSRGIVIGDKCWLGFGVTVLNGVTIGEGAVVAAGSVVRSDVPAWTVVAGNPAAPVRVLDPASEG